MGYEIVSVNGSDREWVSNRYILHFGATRLMMVWGNCLGDALDECIDWVAEHAPGLLCDDEVEELYREAIAEGLGEDDAWERATMDTISGGNCGNRIRSWEWGLVAENPSRSEVLKLQGRA